QSRAEGGRCVGRKASVSDSGGGVSVVGTRRGPEPTPSDGLREGAGARGGGAAAGGGKGAGAASSSRTASCRVGVRTTFFGPGGGAGGTVCSSVPGSESSGDGAYGPC